MLFAVLLVSLTASLIGALSYTRARRALEVEARARLALLARDIAEHLHRELDDRVADIRNWARLEVMRALLYQDVDKELARFLLQTLQGRQTYRAIVCAGVDGRPVAAAGDSQGVTADGAPPSTRVSIVAARPGAEEKMLQFETPIFNPQQAASRIGTLVTRLDPGRMLATVEASVEGMGGDVALALRTATGETVLETGNGLVPARLPRGGRDRSGLLTGIAALGPLSGAAAPALEVVVTEPAATALAAVRALRATLLRLALLVLGVGSALAALVAWRIGVPIRRLTDAVRDVTQRGRLDAQTELPEATGEVGVLAAAFRAMLESLAAAHAEALVQARLVFLGEIAANIAHEVRTPLSVLKTSAQLLARAELPSAEQRRLAAMVAAEVDRLNGVVTGLVDIARPKAVRRRPEPIAEILDRAVGFFGSTAAAAGVRIVQPVMDREMRVDCDGDALYQVFLNVVHNALQAMGGPGVLTVGCRCEDRWAVVDVEDTGPGFAADILPRAFSPFCTTRPDGTGLGLAISKRIVEEHGGTIEASNRPEGGARVRVRLPGRRTP